MSNWYMTLCKCMVVEILKLAKIEKRTTQDNLYAN